MAKAKDAAREYYVRTAGGRKFYYDRPGESEIDFYDIAEHLSKIPRFTGATRPVISVAQHCLHVSSVIEKEGGNYSQRMRALLHDAAEAFIGDMPTPMLDFVFDKTGVDLHEVLQDPILAAIETAAGLPPATAEEKFSIKNADKCVLNTEGARCVKGWSALPGYPAADFHIVPMVQEAAARAFMDRYLKLKVARLRHA